MPPAPATAERNRPLFGIALKVAAVGIFLAMATLLKSTHDIPAGELVFFRSLFAIIPIVAFLIYRGEMQTGWKTQRPLGHLWRGFIGVFGQGFGFYALTQLPLAESTALNYTLPLLIVIASAIVLREEVRLYRWSAVVIGFIGVGIIIWPRLTLLGGGVVTTGTNPGLGAIAALASCVFATFAFLQIRRLTETERSSTIVFYYSITCSLLALLTSPFGWIWPSAGDAVMLVIAGICGGIAQVLLTESFRHADMSVLAPFEYASLIFSIIIGYALFGDVPTLTMVLGSLILVGAGIFIIFREHQLGRRREAARLMPSTPPG